MQRNKKNSIKNRSEIRLNISYARNLKKEKKIPMHLMGIIHKSDD